MTSAKTGFSVIATTQTTAKDGLPTMNLEISLAPVDDNTV
jgi:hypothetical protein